MRVLTTEQRQAVNALKDIYAQCAGGSDCCYRHSGFIYTQAVKAMADQAGAHWLINLIVSYRRKEETQFWTLIVRKNRAVAVMQEDKGRPFLVKQKIPFTDFPQGRWQVWVMNKTIFLPNEY